MDALSGGQFHELLASPFGIDELGAGPRPLVVDWSDGADRAEPAPHLVLPPTTPVVVVGVAPGTDVTNARGLCDVLVGDHGEAEEVVAAVEAQPTAASALALLLRRTSTPPTTIAADLVAESATYSALQASPAHRAWLAGRPPRRPARADHPVVEAARDGDQLDVVLARPERRNAYSAQMRDELVDAFTVALADPTITVRWRARGPAFCSGGDLDEFGTGADPGTNHLVRLARSVAVVLAAIADRVTVHVHGPCVGAGVELPAFAGRIEATPDTTFRLPELAMGLVPGAGGTASLPRRIGRHRTAWLALTGQAVDAATARAWGLVDHVTEVTPG